MARIRSVKPEFFRHEKLQALGPLSMLIFSGLWTQCDKAGRFPWRPRILKLDILPFIDFDMEKELNRLSDHFFIVKYEAEGEFYGVIPTFLDHQRITGKEGLEPAKYPDPPAAKPKKSRKLPKGEEGHAGDTQGTQPGIGGETIEITGREGNKEREKEREKEGNGSASLPARVLDYLNHKTGKNFRAVESNLKLIRSRIADGYTEPDFRKVIDNKTADWLQDPKMEEFLRPSTLFQPSKFDGYLNQINAGAPHGRQAKGIESAAERNGRRFREELGKIAAGIGAGGNHEILPLLPQADA